MGIVALLGSGEFGDAGHNAEVVRRIVAEVGAVEVLVLPTAAAFEHPDRVVEATTGWFAGMGVAAVGLPVLNRADAREPEIVERLGSARMIVLTGGSPLHLKAVLKDSPSWEAIGRVAAQGAMVAVGAAAGAVCDPLTDTRGGGFTIGLGLVKGLAVLDAAETWTAERLHRTRKMVGGFCLAELPSGTALVRRTGADADTATWEVVGEGVELIGSLPD